MLSEGRHLIQSGINPNDLFLDDLEFLYVPDLDSTFGDTPKLNTIPSSWFKGAEMEATIHADGQHDVWDYKANTLTIYTDKDRTTILSERELKEGERKPHGEEKQI